MSVSETGRKFLGATKTPFKTKLSHLRCSEVPSFLGRISSVCRRFVSKLTFDGYKPKYLGWYRWEKMISIAFEPILIALTATTLSVTDKVCVTKPQWAIVGIDIPLSEYSDNTVYAQWVKGNRYLHYLRPPIRSGQTTVRCSPNEIDQLIHTIVWHLKILAACVLVLPAHIGARINQ